MKYINQKTLTIAMIAALICCIKNASAWVIMLNGASSVGKSTITKKFVSKSPDKNNIVVVTFDNFIENALLLEINNVAKQKEIEMPITSREEAVEVFGKNVFFELLKKLDQRKIKEEMQDAVKNFVEKNKNVIIDTVLGDEDFFNTYTWFKLFDELSQKTLVLGVLVYCPLKEIPSRVQKRSKTFDREFRSLEYVLGLFSCLYKSTPPQCQKESTLQYKDCLKPIEIVDEKTINMVLEQCDKEENKQWLKNSFISGITSSLNFSKAIALYPTYIYDLVIMNDGKKKISQFAFEIQETLIKREKNKSKCVFSITKNYAEDIYNEYKQQTRLWANGH
jgi:uridine kinase